MIGSMTMALAATAPLTPSGKWVVDYRTDMCVASRQFGDGTPPTVFAIKPAVQMDGGGAQLYVLAPNTGDAFNWYGTVTITLQPSGEVIMSDYWSNIGTPPELRAFQMPVSADDMTKLGEATSLTVDFGKASFSFAAGKLQAIRKALATCNENLFRTWGVPDVTATAELPPLVNPQSWFKSTDYPFYQAWRGRQGRVVIVLTIGPDGGAVACKVAVSSKYVQLDEATCKTAMKRAHYLPKPGATARYSVLSVRFVL